MAMPPQELTWVWEYSKEWLQKYDDSGDLIDQLADLDH